MYLQIELLCHWQGSELKWECDVELRGDVGQGWFAMIDSCKSSWLCMAS